MKFIVINVIVSPPPPLPKKKITPDYNLRQLLHVRLELF